MNEDQDPDLVLGAGRGGLNDADLERLQALVKENVDAAEWLAWIRTVGESLRSGAFVANSELPERDDCPDEATLAAEATRVGHGGPGPEFLMHVADCPRCWDGFQGALEELAADGEPDGLDDLRTRAGAIRTGPHAVETETGTGKGPERPESHQGPSGLPGLGIMSLAAAALLAISLYVMRSPVPDDPVDLVSLARLEPIPVRIIRSATGEEFGARKAAGLEAYAAESWAEAIQDLTDALQIEPDHPDLWLTLGSAKLLGGDPVGALPAFETAASGGSQLRREALWHSAQAYLLQGDSGPAIERLRELSENPGARMEEARSQLSKIEADGAR